MHNPVKNNTVKNFFHIANKILPLSLLAVLVGHSVSAQAETVREHRLISLQADVSKEVKNDEMQATLFTEKNDTNPTKLAQILSEKMNKAMATAKAYPQVTISTGSQNTSPIYNSKNTLTGWRGRAEVQLKSTDFKATSELIAQLQTELQLENVNFVVSQAQRTSVENDLLTEVTKAFRLRADKLQQAWGATGYELVEQNIETNQNHISISPMAGYRMSDAMATSAPAPQEVSGGNTKIQVSSRGTIQLK